MGTLLKAPSPYYSKMELFRSSWRHSIGRKKSYIIITNGTLQGGFRRAQGGCNSLCYQQVASWLWAGGTGPGAKTALQCVNNRGGGGGGGGGWWGGKDSGRPPSGDKMSSSNPKSLMEHSTIGFFVSVNS